MAAVSSTRAELLLRRTQIKLARQSRDLLEQKRTALMEELLRVAGRVLEGEDTLQETAARAYRALAHARAVAGSETIDSVALASRDEISLQISWTQVMGVSVPTFKRKADAQQPLQRNYSIAGISATVDEAASAFEAEVNAILWLADSELRLKRLADEIQRTSRRFNALEHVLIPRLEQEYAQIQMTLNERERSDHFRLKVAKRRLERKRMMVKYGS